VVETARPQEEKTLIAQPRCCLGFGYSASIRRLVVTVHPRELCSRLAPLGALLALLALAGCGVKGGLELPPGSAPPAPQATGAPPVRTIGGPPPRQSATPDEPFALDPLLR
jgi:predicted small lipoprotein YifL